MADIIQSISKFSQDAIHNAIEYAVQDKQAFASTLEAVQSALKKPPKKQKKKVKMYGNKDDEIFQQKVIPQIRDKLSEYDRLEMNGKYLEWKVCFDFIRDCQLMNMGELKNYHKEILAQDCTLAQLDLLVKFHRGLVYFRARDLFEAEKKPLKVAFDDELGVCYNTAIRYMTFTALIKRYPLLMICRLTYAQLSKHNKRLLEFLKTETEGLGDKLSQALDLSAESRRVHIEPTDHLVPAISFSTDPDHVYSEYCDDEVEDDPQMEEWMAETACAVFEGHDDVAATTQLMNDMMVKK